MTVDELVSELARPIYVFRMASAQIPYSDRNRKSAETRVANARADIDRIVMKYVEERKRTW